MQPIIEIIVCVASLMGVLITIGVWKGIMDTKIKDLTRRCGKLEGDLETEITQRVAEYLQLRVTLQDLATGQDWIIMKLKGEIDG